MQDNNGNTPLHLAAELGHLSVVCGLIELGASVAVKNKQGETPLHLAIVEGHEEVVGCLLEAGADPAQRGMGGKTAWHYAAVVGQYGIIRMLHKYINFSGTSQKSSMCDGKLCQKQKEIDETLLLKTCEGSENSKVCVETKNNAAEDRSSKRTDCKAQADQTSSSDRSSKRTDCKAQADHTSSSDRSSKRTDCKAQADQTSSSQFRTDFPLLHMACLHGEDDTVNKLIEEGADINQIDDKLGALPIFAAVMGDSPRIVSTLLKLGAKTVNSENGVSALHIAAGWGAVDSLKVLLTSSLDPNLRDAKGFTPLHYAVLNVDSVPIAKLLVAAGADVFAKDLIGHSPLDLSRVTSNKDLSLFLWAKQINSSY